jgi:hypothetical protein
MLSYTFINNFSRILIKDFLLEIITKGINFSGENFTCMALMEYFFSNLFTIANNC